MRALTILLAVIASLLVPAKAQVGEPVETGHATSRLIALNDGLVPGETNWIALYQELEEGWHVYWRNQGDSGFPLDAEWDLPEGYEAGDFVYPQPHRLPIGPLVNFGHEGAPVFLVPLTVPAEATPGEAASLAVDATWLICLDTCVPDNARLSLAMPIVAEAERSSDYGALVAEALANRPVEAPFEAAYHDAGEGPVLTLGAALTEPEFFPYEPNLIEPSGRHEVALGEDETRIAMDAGFAYEEAPPDVLEGLVVAGPEGERVSYQVAAERTAVPPALSPSLPGAGDTRLATPNLGLILLLSLVGGLILNVMPCVFPVVFMKASGLAASAHAEGSVQRRYGLLYLTGVLATFALLAGVLIALRAAGSEVGWGFQLQNPVVVGLFALVIFLVGLNLAGLFEVGTSVQGVGQGLTRREGSAGAFFTGALAVAVAAPCIGPFLGVPVGYALSQPPVVAMLVFLVMGLGLAAPYVALSLVPALGRVLPRPGPWMVTFKQLLSFAMFGTLVWLAWVLSLQTGPSGVLALGIALVLAGLAGWAFGRGQSGGGMAWRVVAAAALVSAVVPLARGEVQAPSGELSAGALPAVPYDEATLAELRAAGTPVFVDFTAAWCVTCQVNKQTVLKRGEVVAAFERADARYMVADWTVQDPVITRALERFGRSGVPLYLYYAPGAEEARVLPQVLSVDGVTGLFEERTS